MERDKKESRSVSRRTFIKRATIGTSVILITGWISCSPIRRFIAGKFEEAEASYKNKFEPQSWFEITASNEVLLFSPKVEMGQGVFTGLAQLAAEELGVEMDQIKVKNASTDKHPTDPRGTGNSDSIAGLYTPLRQLAAKMRMMLVANAALILNVPIEKLTVEKGIISGEGKSISFGDIVAKAKEWHIPKDVKLKERKDFKIIGKAIPRVDLLPKVMGAPMYGMDVSMPGMLYGAVVRADKIDAKLQSADTSLAEKMPGVIKVVVEYDFVGVVAKTYTQAHNAKNAIKAKWKVNKVWQQQEIRDKVKVGQGKAFVIQKEGNAEKVLNKENTLTTEYTTPIGAHAQIEPNGAVVHVTKDKTIIKMSTQVVKITCEEVAKRLGISTDKVVLEATFLGGGFGRRLHTPNAVQAAVMSRAVGKPVHVFFDRQQEFQHDTFRPPTHHVLKGSLTPEGIIKALEHNVSSGDVAFGSPMLPGYAETVLGADLGAWRGGMIMYEGIENYQAISWRVNLPFATSWWRGLGLLANTFAIESFLDELANKAGKDPVQFRLAHIKNDDRGNKLKGVIEAAAQKAKWGQALPEGRAQGFAACVDVNTPVAQIAEVSIEKGQIKVHKVTCAIDPGLVVNPDGVRAQCEGAIIMGMSAALKEKMEIVDGAVTPTIYGPYKMAMMRDAPKEIDVVLLESDGIPTGVGEPPIGPIAAAIANAVFKLTGQRLRDIPLKLA